MGKKRVRKRRKAAVNTWLPAMVVEYPSSVYFQINRLVRGAIPPERGNPVKTDALRKAALDTFLSSLEAGKTIREAFPVKLSKPTEKIQFLVKELTDAIEESIELRDNWKQQFAAQEYPMLSAKQVKALTGKYVYLLDVDDDTFYASKIINVVNGIDIVAQCLDTYGSPLKEEVIRAPYWAVFEWTPDDYFDVIGVSLDDCLDYELKLRVKEDPPKRAHSAVLQSWESKKAPISTLSKPTKKASKKKSLTAKPRKRLSLKKRSK